MFTSQVSYKAGVLYAVLVLNIASMQTPSTFDGCCHILLTHFIFHNQAEGTVDRQNVIVFVVCTPHG
eukprot:scaffold13826_cov42-Prasinocladus_malaysianus.AAC.1